MGKYVNPDDKRFKEIVNSTIYVDKTIFIKFMNKVINTSNKYICMSRPRRFGKSTTAMMLVAYYSKGCKSKKLFKRFKISGVKNYKKYLNRYNVIYINMQNAIVGSESINEFLSFIQKQIINELKEEFDCIKKNDNNLINALDKIYNKTKDTFVFIIDEWDSVLRVYNDYNSQITYLRFLTGLLKDQSYIALAYITGIIPIKKQTDQSLLNMFNEYTMFNQYNLSDYTGFTEEEVNILCKEYSMNLEDIKRWYDGYNLSGVSIYNPRSVVCALTNKELGDYWSNTGSYNDIKDYICRDYYGIKDIVLRLLSGESIFIEYTSFENDITIINCVDDILAVLVHLGYLTYDKVLHKVMIPNYEIRLRFIDAIKNSNWKGVSELLNKSKDLLNYTLLGDCNKVAEIINDCHMDNTSIIEYNDENALAFIVRLAYYYANNYYTFYRELQGGKGYADIVLIPFNNFDYPAIIIELKWNKGVTVALNQIKSKNYVKCLKDYHGKVLLVGINYNKKTKKHECLIEEIIV